MNDIQVVASFCVSLFGLGLMLLAYMEANDLEFDAEEIEEEEGR
jgi:hypothetical protein